jgi:ABC-type polysaccharide/polyol phosphate transport system ATPase subunit
MMSDAVIAVRDLSKMYKLYRRSPYRLLDFLGLRIGSGNRYFDEYWALRDLTFDILPGSTVGVIGRNGAGKSTLLKVLSGMSTPTRGEIALNGRVSALLEIGTGFHPDLTGHENIFASGLYLGLDQKAMEALYDEIVAFAELGEFLHQPVRTYSTGMYMRLAFSVATSVPADIQVIDEIIGVGDAYFFGKCLQRFRRLQQNGRTTVLVSHDHATILQLCTRCLWIDRGTIAADGTPLEVIMAYNQSIYDERDRHAAAEVTASGLDLHQGRVLRASGAVRVEGVEFLNETGMPARVFSEGESLTIRIHYLSEIALKQPVISATVYRILGGTVCNAISSMDGARLDLAEGGGAVDVIFDRLLLGPGEYTVAVGIYPSLDLADTVSTQQATIWHKPLTFSVRQPTGVAVDLGVVRHPVRWRITGQQETGHLDVLRRGMP